ncbi:lysosomal-associated transmembrane protein 4A [Folsomia candida]|uniref:Lysosomal-associated transmembrane protein 4A n=1 Tax=Folsomia candida TaxID=158441 RepID=A0A226EDQ2_FOLCA|nr:lysosomal-associated transmembrane protein 4A [Folsomia candida]OXA54931.1 Lysosomal-associated transmembrane protein 4A [Folsomia candida]
MSETCCCGCCTVGQGTLIIGILNIIGGILSIIRDSIEVNIMVYYPDQIKEADFQQNRSRYITVECIEIFMAIVYFIFACLMVQGYRMRNHRLIMPWLIWNYVSLCIVAVSIVILFILLAVAGAVAAGFIMLAMGGIFLAVQTYFVFVVKRFVTELKGGAIY